MRTHTLICFGTALFTVASLYRFGEIAVQVLVAAGIVAAVVLAAGAGLFLISVVTAIFILIILFLLSYSLTACLKPSLLIIPEKGDYIDLS
ncbi:MAG TPA: hypothetical protein G4N93_00195 [Dehalococcoidia bacterium]|nr:hypothetical protein [Dehalococcoidia bacterium]